MWSLGSRSNERPRTRAPSPASVAGKPARTGAERPTASSSVAAVLCLRYGAAARFSRGCAESRRCHHNGCQLCRRQRESSSFNVQKKAGRVGSERAPFCTSQSEPAQRRSCRAVRRSLLAGGIRSSSIFCCAERQSAVMCCLSSDVLRCRLSEQRLCLSGVARDAVSPQDGTAAVVLNSVSSAGSCRACYSPG